MKNNYQTLIFQFIIVANLFLLTACGNYNIKMKSLDHQILQDVPSASGITLINDSIFIIGDNTPWIYRINQNFEIASKYLLGQYTLQDDNIIAKANKPDFEAMEALNRDHKKDLIIFGSGSKSPQRDILIFIDFEQKSMTKTYSLKKFYDHIRSSPTMNGDELNIEAVAMHEDQMFLFNRENNLLFQYPFQEFIDCTTKGKKYPEPKVFKIILPKINTNQAGFSGATSIPGESKIIFTASVENTTNPIDDGEILGSFVGVIDLEKLANQYEPVCVPFTKGKEILKIKVESVAISNHKKQNQAEVLFVTDSDGGYSEIIKSLLKWKK